MKINNATPNLIKQVPFSSNISEKAASSVKELPRSGFSKLFELERKGSMGRTLFLVNCFMFLLGGRLLGSRDRNEARETLTRDVPTFIVVALSIPFLQKQLAKRMQEKSGFALVNESKELASTNQIQNWYQYDKNMTTGFNGFSQRLVNTGGNLKKIFSRLDEETKSKLANFNENNDKFINELSKDAKLKQSIVEKFQKAGNNAFEHAGFLKSIPTLLGFGITLSLIGIFIPKFNIFMTARINKKEAMEKAVKEKAVQKQTDAKSIK